jgi:hypothetical protein
MSYLTSGIKKINDFLDEPEFKKFRIDGVGSPDILAQYKKAISETGSTASEIISATMHPKCKQSAGQWKENKANLLYTMSLLYSEKWNYILNAELGTRLPRELVSKEAAIYEKEFLEWQALVSACKKIYEETASTESLRQTKELEDKILKQKLALREAFSVTDEAKPSNKRKSTTSKLIPNLADLARVSSSPSIANSSSHTSSTKSKSSLSSSHQAKKSKTDLPDAAAASPNINSTVQLEQKKAKASEGKMNAALEQEVIQLREANQKLMTRLPSMEMALSKQAEELQKNNEQIVQLREIATKQAAQIAELKASDASKDRRIAELVVNDISKDTLIEAQVTRITLLAAQITPLRTQIATLERENQTALDTANSVKALLASSFRLLNTLPSSRPSSLPINPNDVADDANQNIPSNNLFSGF